MITRRSARLSGKPLDTTQNAEHAVKTPPVRQAKNTRPTRSQSIVQPSQTDPLIKHLKEFYELHERPSLDAEILDQIALEGLVGITFNKLIQILHAIYPSMNFAADEKAQLYLWSIIARRYLRDIRIFHVKQASVTLEPRAVNVTQIVIDRRITLPPQTVQHLGYTDRYIYPIQDGKIMGSCEHYKTRVDVTTSIIDHFSKNGAESSLEQIREFNWDSLRLVANQEIRRKAIFPCWADPNVDIKLREYCTLELIGRSRTMGAVFPNDKTLGRYRIMLMSKGFITQYQLHSSCPIEHHLKRFTNILRDSLMLGAIVKGVMGNGPDNDGELLPIPKLCCDPSRLKSDRDILTMVYDVISRSNGKTQIGLRRKLRLPKFHVRNHIKNLVCIRMIGSRASKELDDDKASRIYKVAYKTKRSKRKQLNQIKTKGIMSKWDEKDVKAKKILGYRRSSFSQAEDSMLILCRITSILVNPQNRLSWCVHKHLIRDLLHREYVESQDKTSDACLRRIKYLKRLPSIIMSINELTAELRDDTDIVRLIQTTAASKDDNKTNKVFVQVLRAVRAKIPHLLGIASSISCAPSNYLIHSQQDNKNHAIEKSKNVTLHHKSVANVTPAGEIKGFNDLRIKYELIDCESVASINRNTTFEKSKNSVDIKFNNATLVTLAFTLVNSLNPIEDINQRRQAYNILERFYFDYHEKLITSMFSKLNKRSLLTRKNPQANDQVGLHKTRSRVSLKLNQNVFFLLNRYHSSSLMQLVRPISQVSRVDLNESNNMASVALLASLCCLNEFNLDLKLKIPENLVNVDEGNEISDCLVVQPCSIQFSTSNNSREADLNISAMEEYLSRSKPSEVSSIELANITETRRSGRNSNKKRKRVSSSSPTKSKRVKSDYPSADGDDVTQSRTNMQASIQQQTNWLVNGFRIATSEELKLMSDEVITSARGSLTGEKDANCSVEISESDEQTNKLIRVEYSARLWKQLDGTVHMPTLLKLIESILSWLIVLPGVELDLLLSEFGHLMPHEHLIELINLMERLELISSTRSDLSKRPAPRLFGWQGREHSSQQPHHEARDSSSSTTISLPFDSSAEITSRCSPGLEDQRNVSISCERYRTRDEIITYEPDASAYIKFCRLTDLYLK